MKPATMSPPFRAHSRGDRSGKKQLRRGRWTQDEHDVFLDGYNRFGRNWKRIAMDLYYRDHIQVRTHAQKYFKKLRRQERRRNAASEVLVNSQTSSDNVYISMAHSPASTSSSSLDSSGSLYIPDFLEQPLPEGYDQISGPGCEQGPGADHEPEPVGYGYGYGYDGASGCFEEDGGLLIKDVDYTTPLQERFHIFDELTPKLKEPLSPPLESKSQTLRRELSFSLESAASEKDKPGSGSILERFTYPYAERNHHVTSNHADSFLPTETRPYD